MLSTFKDESHGFFKPIPAFIAHRFLFFFFFFLFVCLTCEIDSRSFANVYIEQCSIINHSFLWRLAN